MGIAPEANLFLHDIAYSYSPTHWTTGTSAAAIRLSAVVQNNSWGFDEQYGAADLDVVLAYKSNISLTGAAITISTLSKC